MSAKNDFEQESTRLEHYLKEHQAFYSLARSKTADLEAFSSALRRISVRNVEAGLSDTDKMVYDGLVKEIEDIAETLQSACYSQSKLSADGTNKARATSNDQRINDLRTSLDVAIFEEQQAMMSLLSIASSIKTALELGRTRALRTTEGERSCNLEKRGNEAPQAARMLLVSVAMIIGCAKSARATVELLEAQQGQWHQLENDLRVIACEHQ